jgi:pilus assembly protein CpaE
LQKGTTVAAAKQIHIVVITAPERLEQEWITRLSNEADVERVERVGVFTAGMELVQQSRPDVVIVDRDLDQAEAGIRQIFTSIPGSPCIALVAQPDMAVLRRLVAVGARDVLGKPVQHNELMNSIRSVLATEADRRTRSLVPFGAEVDTHGRGKLVIVISPKGGVGTTTIATNIAVGLRQMSGGRVALADFGLQFGDIGVHLNLWSKHTLQDLLSHVEDIDDAMLGQVLQQHSSGIQVMLAPNEPGVAGEITSTQLEAILDSLLERHTYVVADTWSFLDEVAETLLRRADEVLVVTTPEVPSLKNAKHFLEFLRQQDLAHGRITLVLNRFPSVDGISLQDVQQHLRHPVGANIPSEGQLVTHSVNRGIPVVLSHPQSWAAQSLLKLAAHVAGDKVSTISLTPDNLKGGKSKEQPTHSDKERRGLLRFARREV